MNRIFLKPYDSIALTCPGYRCDNYPQVVQTAEYLNRQYKLKSYYQKETYESYSAKRRAEIFFQHLCDPRIKLIWALRGGEGSADLIPILHQKKREIKKLQPKLLMGFSDITALLLYFSQQYHWPVIHGFNARQLALKTISPHSKKLTFDLLFQSANDLSLILKPLNVAAEKTQQLKSAMTGGNLSLINISIQDNWAIQTKNKLLFLEDVNEKPHAVLRTLKYFNRIGLFKKARGIILGQFTNPKSRDKTLSGTMYHTLKSWAQTIDKPVWHTSHIGHGENNIPIPFYQKGHLKTISLDKAILSID